MDIEPAIWVAAATPGHARKFMLPLEAACERFEIDNEKRLCGFLAQCAHESAGFSRLEENLDYSATRLMAVWPKRFPTIESAEACAHNPKKLANRVYSGRMGNRIGTDDGWSYRGRGLIQLTGREHYKAAGDAVDLPLLDKPEMAAIPNGAALTAAWYWHEHGLNKLADDDTPDSFRETTRKINGGYHGIEDRLKRLNELRKVMGLPVLQLRRNT